MISWFRFYMQNNKPIALGQHDRGVCCFMDHKTITDRRSAYVILKSGPFNGARILEGIALSKSFVGNAGKITEELDKYINENPQLQYYYEWPPIDLTKCTEYVP